MHTEVAYAICLLARGGEDGKALLLLESAISKNSVSAAAIHARYIVTGGGMDLADFDEENVREGWKAYGRVVHIIARHPDYPGSKFVITEGELQNELTAYYYLALIPYWTFNAGLRGHHNLHLLQAESYAGPRDLNLYPKYRDHTIDELHRTVENAQVCVGLPMKPHFEQDYYGKVTAHCRLFLDVSRRLLPMETERLTLLNEPSCRRDIEKCPDYEDVKQRMIALFKEEVAEGNRIWGLQ